MQRQVLTSLLLALLLLAACQSSPPTVVYIVVSPTPDDGLSVMGASAPETQTSPQPNSTSNTNGNGNTDTPSPTSTPDIFPTPLISQVQVAEQVFEGGRMFWIQPVEQIWVMVVDEEGSGSWLRYEDTFVEGEPESDPSIEAPEGFIQPVRGFGKLWRENPEVRDALGWAVTPEFGYISRYEYHPGGEVVDDEFVRGFGYHILFSLNSEAFRFDEETSTWRLN